MNTIEPNNKIGVERMRVMIKRNVVYVTGHFVILIKFSKKCRFHVNNVDQIVSMKEIKFNIIENDLIHLF